MNKTNKHYKLYRMLALGLVLVLTFGITIVALAEDPAPAPTIVSDKYDYAPGELVTLTGANWQGDTTVRISVDDDLGQNWYYTENVVVQADGTVVDSFNLPTLFVAQYYVTATGLQTGRQVTTSFTDANIGLYDQCANDDGDGYGGNPGTCSWTNGNLQRNNSTYSEGDATVQRLWLTDLGPNSTHTVTFKYGTTKGGKHAYDYLTTWDWSENWITLDDRCKGATPSDPPIPGCTTASQLQFQIPDDPNVPNSIEPAGPAGRLMTIAGGKITNISAPVIVSGDYTGDSETVITISYTVGPDTGSMCTGGTCGVVFWFGAHVSMTAQWMAYNGTTGASTVTGSPYHVALHLLDGASAGQRDNQMQASAVPLNGTIKIVKDAVPNDAQDFNFNLTNGSTFNQNFSLDDDADATLPNSMSFSLPAGTYTASELFPLAEGWTYTNLACTVTGSNGSSYTVDLANAKATITLMTSFTTSDTVTCTYTDTKALYLTISKDASTSLTRTHTWTIDKKADGEYWKFIGDPATTHSYEVSVDKTTTDSAWAASGKITIVNNTGRDAKITGVSDVISTDITATVSCGVTFPYTLAAGGTLNCTYSASLPNADTRTNTVTVTTDGTNYVQGGTATAEVNFTSPTVTVVGSDSINVTDTIGGPWGPVSADTTFPSYTKDFSCPTDPAAYTDGVYNAPDAVNTAKITETGLTDTATVKLHCYAPVPSKSADASFTRTYTWDITKDYDGTYSLNAGETVTHDYLVTVTKTTTDSGFVVSGVITVVNPNPNAPMTVALSDSVGGTPATITADADCDYAAGNLNVPANSTATCGYSATLDAATNGTNTATVTLNSINFTATKDYTFVTNVVGYNAINVTDTNGQTWGPVSADTSWPYTKDFTCPSDPSLYTDGVYKMVTHENTATITETGDYDTATVDVTCSLAALKVTKTAAGTWNRDVYWTLEKSVDPTSHEGYAGDDFLSTWTVVATKHDSGRYGFTVTGEISIYNPAAVTQYVTGVTDVLDDSTSATVDCGAAFPITIESLDTLTCSYTASPADNAATKNTATVTATGNPAQSDDDPIEWSEILTGDDDGNLTDPRFTYEALINVTTSVDFDETFTCSTDPSRYTNGSYTETFTNDAYFVDDDQNLHADAQVGITCTLQPLVPTKTAAGEWDRTVTWTLSKSVDDDSHIGFAGDVFTSTWTIVADKTDSGPFGFVVAGTIEVYNPAAIAQTFTVGDVLNDLAGTVATVDCPSYTVDPLATVTCTYEALPGDATATLNTATVSAAGNPDQTATATVGWTENLTGYDSGDLTDPRFTYANNISSDTTVTFDETFACSIDPDDYTDGSYTDTFTNDAFLDGNIDLSASEDVGITCTLQPLVPTKTAAGEWDRTVTWKLHKGVDDNSHTGYAGDSFDSTWMVEAYKYDSGPYNFVVEGTIEVYNPAAIAQTFTVEDVLNDLDGTAAMVDCPSYTVESLATVTCTYKAEPWDGTATLNTATVTAAGNLPQSDDDAIEWTENLYGYNSGDLTDPRFSYVKNISGDTTVTFKETFTCSTDPDDYTNGSYTDTFTNWAYLDGNIDLEASEQVGITCYLQPLVPTKTAAGTWNRDVYWTLEKSVDPASHEGYAGDDFLSTWTVIATKHDSGNYGFTVTGEISIYNPAAIAQSFTVVDELNDWVFTQATVDCPSYTVDPLQTVTCTYVANPVDATPVYNVAIITAAGNEPQYANAEIGWSEILTGDDDGSLTDPRFDYQALINITTSVDFDETFTCSTDPSRYTNGSYTETFTNEAYLVTDDQSLDADAQVGITCHLPALQVTKTAAGTWNRNVYWTLEKSVADGVHEGFAGDSFPDTWTVLATKHDSGRYDFTVTGEISIYNPATIAQNFTIADVLDDGTAADVTCPATSVGAGATVKCTYTASPADDAATKNTATVTATGNLPQSDDDPIEWSEILTGDDDGSLTDPRFDYEALIKVTTSVDIDETFSCSTDPTNYTNGSYTEYFTNDAYLVTDDQNLHADAEVGITCHLPALTATKDATATYKQDITWTLEKTVSDDSHSGFAGQDAGTSTWQVVATKTIGEPYGWLVTGKIYIHNPAAIPQTFSVSDLLDDGTNATVTCPDPAIVPAGGDVECSYTASPVAGTATKNTATITAVGNPDITAEADVSYGSIHVGSETAVLDDGLYNYSEEINQTTILTWEQTFSCSDSQSSYTNGWYDYDVTNTATLKFGETTLTKEVTVGVDCTLKPLVPTKTAQGEWDRTVTWTLEKSVVETSYKGFPGDEFNPTWTVKLTKIVDGPKNWKITGEIKVYNPAAIPQTFTVADTLDDGTLVTVKCPSYEVASLGTVTCTYEAKPDDASATLNTAVVSATGNADVTATADVPWKENLTGSDSGNLTDPRFTYDQIVSDTTTVTQDETFTCSTDPTKYTNGSYTESFTNNAYFKNVNTDLHADASVGITCYWPANAKVVKNTTEGPEDIGQFPFTFKLYNPSGTLVETKTLSAAGEVTFATEIKTSGTWKIVEVLPFGWVSQDTSLTCSFAVSFWADAGKTFTCTFNNKEMGRVSVYKLSKGPGDPAPWIDTSKDWVFKIYNGPDGFGGTALATDSTLNDPTGLLDFGFLNLDPGKTYTICELNIPSGWSAEWKIDTDGDGVPDQIVMPYNPNADDPVPQDLGNRCFDFGANTSYAVPVGDTLAFQVINEYPGGAPRTPGYWKNWNRCTGGGQADNADRQGGRAEGYTLLEDILTSPGIIWDDILSDNFPAVPITTCEQAVEILDQRVVTLNGRVGDGKKLASDAARTLAMHLLAAQLNEGNGACINQDVKDVILAAEKLLDTINFDGKKTTAYLTSKSKDYAYALQLAKYLDAYNNSDCMFNTLPPKPTLK